MGARYYFKKRELVIEGAHIVMAQFEAAYDVEQELDLDSGITRTAHRVPSRAIITLDAIELENEYSYEGSVHGTASKSVEINIFGNDAEEFWKLYASAYHTQVIGGGV